MDFSGMTISGGVTIVPPSGGGGGSGTQKAIFGYGQNNVNSTIFSLTNLVSNTGVVATDTAGVGTSRYQSGAASYGYA